MHVHACEFHGTVCVSITIPVESPCFNAIFPAGLQTTRMNCAQPAPRSITGGMPSSPSSYALEADAHLILRARAAAPLYLTDATTLLDQACAECGTSPDTLRRPLRLCSSCQKLAYCGPECQRRAWIGGHKALCRALAAEAFNKCARTAEGDTTASLRHRAAALHNLGLHYASGRGVARDPGKALAAYRAAAALGSAVSMTNLGSAHDNGDLGLAKDSPAALAWFSAAADAGDPLAMCILATRYMQGNGVERNLASAVQWARRGAALGHPESAGLLGSLLYTGRDAVNDLDARDAWRIAAEGGNADAMLAYGNALRDGPGRVDVSEALVWFERAAGSGCVAAHSSAGRAYSRGEGSDVNHALAFEHYARGAAAGDIDCVGNLANCNFDGRGTSHNPARAMELWQQSLAMGAKGAAAYKALTGIASVLLQGAGGVPRDLAGGMASLLRAACTGVPAAMERYAYLRLTGADPEDRFSTIPGCGIDPIAAEAWTRASLASGFATPEAARLLQVALEARRTLPPTLWSHDPQYLPPAPLLREATNDE